MADIAAVKAIAERLRASDEAALELRVGMLSRMLTQDPSIAGRVDIEPTYQEATMGALDDVKALGRRVLKRWNKELYGIVCGSTNDDQADRKAILSAISLGEAAVVGAVATALISMAVPAPIAAAAAPFIVKRFIWPAKDELCAAWGEKIKSEG